MTALGEFLKGAACDRGPWNCSTLAADWCVSLGHPDFADAWRGVTDPVECDQVAAEGLAALWDHGIGDALPVAADAVEGCSLFAWAQPGDIAVISLAGVEAGAIWTGQRLAIKAARGLHFVEPEAARVLKAWRP